MPINPHIKLLIAQAHTLRRATKEAEAVPLGGFCAQLLNPAYEALVQDALVTWDNIVRPTSIPPKPSEK
jgi:hypothetical protein